MPIFPTAAAAGVEDVPAAESSSEPQAAVIPRAAMTTPAATRHFMRDLMLFLSAGPLPGGVRGTTVICVSANC